MDARVAIVIMIVVAVLIVIGVGAVLARKRRSERLRQQFGPEYFRSLEQHKTVRDAEAELDAREQRVRSLSIRALAPDERERFVRSWRSVQARFVDDPGLAVAEADRLIRQVMQTRGYPVGDFEQRAADISVDHPKVVNHYRAAHRIAAAAGAGRASTEDLRRAMVHYRELHNELLEIGAPERRMEVGG
jgi:hypothetical protein